MRRAAKRDAVEDQIVRTLRAGGFSVEFLSGDGLPDLLLGRHGRNRLAEVKSGKKKLRDSQIHWHETWRGEAPIILRTVEDALALIEQYREVVGS